MTSLPAFLGEAKYVSNKKNKKRKYAISESKVTMYTSPALLADFGVPMWQRAAIEAKEGFKTLKGVAEDVVSSKAWTDPKKNKQWTENLGQGFSEARNRVKQSLRKANDKNIMSELKKNKALELELDGMRQVGKRKYSAGELRDLAPLSRSENDGVLAVDKRFNIGKKAKK